MTRRVSIPGSDPSPRLLDALNTPAILNLPGLGPEFDVNLLSTLHHHGTPRDFMTNYNRHSPDLLASFLDCMPNPFKSNGTQAPKTIPTAFTGGSNHQAMGAGLSFEQLWGHNDVPSLEQLQQIESRIDSAEKKFGKHYPPVGKAWMSISRMYRHLGSLCHGAERTVQRAQECLNACRGQVRSSSCGSGSSSGHSCDDSFEYLLDRSRSNEMSPAPEML